MLSVDQCKKLLPTSDIYADQQIEEIANTLHQLASILVDEYLMTKGVKKDCKNVGNER